jgi:hypothetical protein
MLFDIEIMILLSITKNINLLTFYVHILENIPNNNLYLKNFINLIQIF